MLGVPPELYERRNVRHIQANAEQGNLHEFERCETRLSLSHRELIADHDVVHFGADGHSVFATCFGWCLGGFGSFGILAAGFIAFLDYEQLVGLNNCSMKDRVNDGAGPHEYLGTSSRLGKMNA